MSQFYFSHIVLIQSTFTVLLLALSIQIQFRMGVFSFAGAGFYGIGAYGASMLVLHADFDSVSAIVTITLICALIGYLLALVVQRLSGLHLAMATVSFTMILTVIAHNGGEWTGGSVGLFGVMAFPMMSVEALATICLVVIGLAVLSERGRLGRRIEAVREDPELASAMGISVQRYRTASFVISGMLGALGGSLNVLMMTAVAPESVGFPLIVLALTIIIVGGSRSWLGVLLGAVIFTWLPVVLEQVGTYQAIVYGCIVAVAAVYMPGGITGVVTDVYRKYAARRVRDGDDTTVATAAAENTPSTAEHDLVEELTGSSGSDTVTTGERS
ncbi:branched-chain amino acid ABC transporter permease [Rhodococcus marinonascens]|uniref:branched-chain amino acid ABC transporter permease n=1 Tax=Rhodococcus marinonascens TaxID=38311 RepID=UPI000933C2E2|nr:branched-chain amino acid ABC transporter permease [Rhodococcus marinonascens]